MSILAWLPFVLVLIAVGGVFLTRDWRWNIGWLVVQYLAVFWLVQTSWSLPMAAVKLVTGWMVSVALAIAHLTSSREKTAVLASPGGGMFHVAVIGLILAVTYAGGVGLGQWLGMSLPPAWGALLLIGMGLVNTGISNQPFRVTVGLLTALSGFEIVYASVETSSLVTGLLALVNLGLALVGAYFLSHQDEKVIE